MPTKVYVGNLPENCNQGQLRDLFVPYGQIAELDIIKNYAFIHFVNEEDAKSAVGDLHKSKLQGKEIQVEISKRQNVNRDTRPPPRRHDGPDNRGPGGPPPRGRMDHPRGNNPNGPRPMGNSGPGLLGPGALGGPGGMGGSMGPTGLLGPTPYLGNMGSNGMGGMLGGGPGGLEPASIRDVPDPDVRVRREAVSSRNIPNAEKLGITGGYVIYERYYVDSDHPLLKGLPLPELPRITDSYSAGSAFPQRSADPYDSFGHRPSEPPRSAYAGGNYRDRSPRRDDHRDHRDRR